VEKKKKKNHVRGPLMSKAFYHNNLNPKIA